MVNHEASVNDRRPEAIVVSIVIAPSHSWDDMMINLLGVSRCYADSRSYK